MPVNIGQFAPNGLAIVQVGARGGAGLFTGFANLTTADTGDNSGMRRLRGSTSAASPVPAINRVRNRGDNGYVATFLYESEPPEFNLEFEQYDLEAEVFFQGGALYTLGDWDMAARGQGIPNLQDSVVIITRDAESEDTGSTGNGYDNAIILSSKYRPVPGNFAYQAAGTMVYAGAADRVQTTPWGATVANILGLSDAMVIEMFTEYPLTMECFIGDNTTTAVPLTYAPVTAAKTKAFNAGSYAALTVSSVDVGAKTATLSAAPASGAHCVLLYETTGL